MFSEFSLPIVFYIFLVMPFAVSVVGVTRWSRLDVPLKVLVTFSTLDGLGTIFATYLATKGTNNLWLTHIFTIVELFCFLYIFSRWQANRATKWWASVMFGLFVVLWIVSKLSLEQWYSFDSYTSPIEKMILIVFASLALARTAKDHETFVFAKASFWVPVGILIYSTGSLMLLAAGNNLVHLAREDAIKVWTTYWIVGSLANLTYAGGLLCRKIQ